MKKITLVTILLLSIFSFGQNYKNFPSEDVQQLLNKELKVKSVSAKLQEYGYSGFYKDEKLKTKFACCENYNSKYSSLVDKIFTVISYEPYISVIGDKKYKLLLSNDETGKIYFDYNPKYEHTFPFEVIGGLTLSEDFYCKKITTSFDKFTNETKLTAHYKNVDFLKITKNNVSRYYMSIRTSGSTVSVNEKGLIILLENGKRLEKPNATIDVDVNTTGYGNAYLYSTFINLTESDIKILLTNKITDARLYIYDTDLKESGEALTEYLKCLTK